MRVTASGYAHGGCDYRAIPVRRVGKRVDHGFRDKQGCSSGT